MVGTPESPQDLSKDMPKDMDAERARRVRGRNMALGLVLGGFALLIFFISIAKMGI